MWISLSSIGWRARNRLSVVAVGTGIMDSWALGKAANSD